MQPEWGRSLSPPGTALGPWSPRMFRQAAHSFGSVLRVTPRLPSRYEDLDVDFRGRLRRNDELIDLVQKAFRAITVSGGLRFLPVFGRSGSGKSCAARELATHLPDARVVELTRQGIQSEAALLEELRSASRSAQGKVVIAIVDQYEEAVAQAENLPTQFVERLSLLDRSQKLGFPVLFIWLTTSREFQKQLADATTRNERVLLQADFELVGPAAAEWANIVEETFAFHNQEQPLADFGLLRGDIEAVADTTATLGRTIELVGEVLGEKSPGLHDLSQYQVLMLWPVTDALRITRVTGFTNSRDGYRLDWNAFYRELTAEDRANTQTMSAYNRARLYFDVRLIPIAAADLQALSKNLSDPAPKIADSYLNRFRGTHLHSIVAEKWDPSVFSPLRERASKRADEARAWYEGVTSESVALGRRISHVFGQLGYASSYEAQLSSPHRNVRADVLVERIDSQQSKVCIELKAFSTEATRPSSIRDAVRGTLRKYAQFAGFIEGD